MKRSTCLLLILLACTHSLRADLRDTTNAADYLIISTSELIQQHPWITDLADWRDQHGRTSMIVSTEEIWSEFGDGTPSDTHLKEFLHFARLNWQEPQLADVFLIGHHDVVPSHVEESDLVDSIEYVSDYFYVTSGDPEEYQPLFSMGRLPWSPMMDEPLWDYYSKIVTYETAAEAPWLHSVHIIADESNSMFDWPDQFAEPIAELIPPQYSIERDYLDFGPQHDWHGDRDEILANLESGSLMMYFCGHATGNIWSEVLQLSATDFVGLTNSPAYPVVVGPMINDIYDLDGQFVVGDVPRAFLSNPDGGAIAYFAETTVGWANAGRLYRLQLTEALFNPENRTAGSVWQAADDAYVEAGPVSGSRRETLLATMLFGDPGLRLPDRITAAEDRPKASIPESVKLLGSYPNPFNPSTTLRYSVGSPTHVTLTIYDIQGREVRTLIDKVVTSGEHSVEWRPDSRAAGVYLAALRSGGTQSVTKLVYLK